MVSIFVVGTAILFYNNDKMRILSYLKKIGDKSFKEQRLNDVDALIFSELSYINFHLLTKGQNQEICLKDITDEEMNNKAVFEGSVDAKKNAKMLDLMRKSVRFKDCVVKEVVNKFSVEEENQFYCFLIVLPTKQLFISYRGTDTTLTGWKEDFLLSVYARIRAQVQGEMYLNDILKRYPGRIYLGGHSKGGNIAFYAALNIDHKEHFRLVGAYSFDGPGFKDGIDKYKSTALVKGRLIKYLTFNNVIGSLYGDIDHVKVVYSFGILGGHDPFNWQIVNSTGRFRLAYDVSRSSKRLNRKFMGWLDTLSLQQKLLTVDAFFRVFGSGNNTIYDLAKNFLKNLFTVKKSLAVYSSEEKIEIKKVLRSLLGFMFKEKRMRRRLFLKEEAEDVSVTLDKEKDN